MNNDILSVGIWNTQWKSSGSRAGTLVIAALDKLKPQVVCITEGHLDQLQTGWNVCPCDADHGYRPLVEGRRKVILFSRNAWRDIDSIGHPELPPGRFIAATTDTAIGPIRFLGVCIPWYDAHVSTGMRNRTRWEDHKSYLNALKTVVADSPIGSVLLGDFNQRIPRQRQPPEIEELLKRALGDRMQIVTSGLIPGVDELSIDHLGCDPSLVASSISGLSKTQDGVEVSDHFGLVVKLVRN